MAETPEGRVKRKICEWIIKTWPNAYFFRYPAGMFGRSGIPDIIACIEGVFLAIEVKSDVGVVTALQMHELRRITSAKGVAAVVKGYDLVKLEKIKIAVNDKIQRLQLACA